MKEIVINSCYGGFGISALAMKLLVQRGSSYMKCYEPEKYYGSTGLDQDLKYREDLKKARDLGDGFTTYHFGEYLVFYKGKIYMPVDYYGDIKSRSHSDLIGIIRELGKDADGTCAELKIVTVPSDVSLHIEEYDGYESVHEDHREWS